MTCAVSSRLAVLLLPLVMQTATAQPVFSRPDQEAFLRTAAIVDEAGASAGPSKFRRVTLGDGQRTHDAAIETAASPDGSSRDYRYNVAAYELDKALALGYVVPSVVRTVDGQPAAFTWWVDDVAMNELGRRGQEIEPPDPERWRRQMQVVRVFDELVANTYRNVSPEFRMSTIWDNLLITKDWTIWLVDHTRTFGTSRQLQNPESLGQCERGLLASLRRLNRDALQRSLEKYLTPAQLDALEARRALLVKHFADEIGARGEDAVLYDLPPRR